MVVLRALGLSRAEQDLYKQLVGRQPMTFDELDEVAGTCGFAGQTDAVLSSLSALGLVVRWNEEPPRWSAAPPNAALQALLSDRYRALAVARRYVAEMVNRFDANRMGDDLPAAVEVIYGREEILLRSEDFQRAAMHEIRSCDAPPYPEPEPATVNTIEVDQLREGIRYRILYDPRGLDVPGRLVDLEAGIAAGEQARVADIPLKLTLFDRTAAMLPLRHPPDVKSRLIVHDPVLVDALSALFELYWNRALPLQVSDGRAELSDHDGRPSADERRLLPLLVAGLTDREIAGQVGLSERTVRTRVRAMLTRLDVATRFQAGYQAVRRGWLTIDDQNSDRADAVTTR